MQPLPDLLILRHGETEWNREGRMQGRLDSPLTPEGRAQARLLGRMLRRLGVTPDSHAALTSPQPRASITADLALVPLGFGITADPDLVEIDMGRWAGLTRAEILARWPGPPDEDWIALYARVPDGESFDALFARAESVLARIVRPSVIVTHGVTSRFLRAAALGLGRQGVADLPGGQGVIHRIRDGGHETIAPTAADGAPA